MNIPTAHSSESLERFTEHILNAPTPKQVTRQYLETNGFESGNDPELRHIFRLLSFLNDNDEPTKLWKEYKQQGVEVLRKAVEDCYGELFTLFPDAAYGRTDEELKNWFHPPLTGESRTSVERAIRTFKKLCVLVGIVPDNRVKNAAANDQVPLQTSGYTLLASKHQLVIQIPPLGNAAEYDQLFESIKRNFYN